MKEKFISNALLIFIVLGLVDIGRSQQIAIPRIEMMPNMPVPYEMRNWKEVTAEYDRFVFDFNKTGQYLPLIWWQTGTFNYPQHNSFGLHTVVGTRYPGSSEAINVIPAVIGASLVGIDKSNQNGSDWVLMCEEFFNKASGANVYLNHPGGGNWDDWWYDMMPNVFFYQLYDLYPHTGDFDFQFTSVADRWLSAVMAMGGSTTPWDVPYMNYRAFNLMTMTPFAASPTEPEAAGAIAWLLYNAFLETGQPEYRVGAELCMEFLSNLGSNPSYELQLPYGAHIAARMNAELGTAYDLTKMVDWCFTTLGNVRNWGAIVGNWGGYDCSGLIGEVSSNDYAFTMNTFEQAGALVPMVRYDDRFARAIGKWVLNAANASRLYYTDYLPDDNQDSEAWSHQYDSSSVIAHEALHEYSPYNSAIRPYATGDAVTGGWGYTNLTLYGSSHVGIMGAIIDTTDVEGILMLDALVTDYFHQEAYPTHLIYNPYNSDTTIQVQLEPGTFDLYDAVSNTFILQGVNSVASISVPSDNAILLVRVPSGGTISYHLDHMLVDGIVVDYRSNQPVSNYPPRIKSVSAEQELLVTGDSTRVYCTATDRDQDTLSYYWTVSGGSISGSSFITEWTAPAIPGQYSIQCMIEDPSGERDTAETVIEVVEYINQNPVIQDMSASPRKIDLGGISTLTCTATDSDPDTLTYTWASTAGVLQDSADTAVWTAPATIGNYYITCRVDDGRGGSDIDSIGIVVRDFSAFNPGKLVAFYPFNGNANDESGNGHHGTVSGAVLTQDRFGNSNKAYLFDGLNDNIRIPNHDSLNFQQAISVNFWMRIDQLYDREAFPISHGSWENRWKVSIIPEHKLRWTIKTNSPISNGIIDLDTQTILTTGRWMNITVFYDGADFEIYVDGELDNFASWSGLLRTTSYDLTIGQMLPNNSSYNFKGVLDDIRIYNYGLSVQEIRALAGNINSLPDENPKPGIFTYNLHQNFPNPFNPETTIRFEMPFSGYVSLSVFDMTGKQVAELVKGNMPAGVHEVVWKATNYASGIYVYQLKANGHMISRKMILMK